MTQAAKAQEPSMEEILASIRRIIADDDAGKGKAPEAPKARAPSPPPAPPPPAAPPQAASPPPPPRTTIPTPPPVMPMAPPGAKKIEPPPPPPEPEPEPAADVLDLTEAMEVPPPPPPTFRKIDPAQDLAFDEAAPPKPEPPAPAPDTLEMARREFERETESDRSLLSAATTRAVDNAFNSLANTVLVQNSRTLDDLVREMLRPMLKAWLDDNLPNMVERLVRAEIERVARGRNT